METLYRFKLDRTTGKIERVAIKEYTIKENYIGKMMITYRLNSRTSMVSADNIERYLNDMVYSYNSSIDNAIEIIKADLENKIVSAKNTLDKCTGILERIESSREFVL